VAEPSGLRDGDANQNQQHPNEQRTPLKTLRSRYNAPSPNSSSAKVFNLPGKFRLFFVGFPVKRKLNRSRRFTRMQEAEEKGLTKLRFLTWPGFRAEILC